VGRAFGARRRQKEYDVPQPYTDKAHAQEHFLSVLKVIKQRVDEHRGVSKRDPAFGRRWSSCAIVRPGLDPRRACTWQLPCGRGLAQCTLHLVHYAALAGRWATAEF
jgi:hypothetical protein